MKQMSLRLCKACLSQSPARCAPTLLREWRVLSAVCYHKGAASQDAASLSCVERFHATVSLSKCRVSVVTHTERVCSVSRTWITSFKMGRAAMCMAPCKSNALLVCSLPTRSPCALFLFLIHSPRVPYLFPTCSLPMPYVFPTHSLPVPYVFPTCCPLIPPVFPDFCPPIPSVFPDCCPPMTYVFPTCCPPIPYGFPHRCPFIL